jgi:hypothetical protein
MSTEAAVQTFTLSTLVADCPGGIRIPMIQRDYAQGRSSWKNPRLRFLADLKQALLKKETLHLDFVYGVKQVEDDVTAFCPLDGQQRLTTLFLLHWYLASRDYQFAEFQKTFLTDAGDSRFTYQVRPGGRSFFQLLVKYAPKPGECQKTKPSQWMAEQPWFRTVWMRDPTVAGALAMLDAIHGEFQGDDVGYQQLVNGDRITFQRFDLEAAGLHDDLYLRMNARGRPLSTFETFKARYENHLKLSFPDAADLSRCTTRTVDEFSGKIDNQWLDFIWNRYGPKVDPSGNNAASDDTRSVDAAFINLFQAVALASLPSRERNAKKDDVAVISLSQGEPDYDDFENGGWLEQRFTVHLIHVLEALTGNDAAQNLDLLGSPWFGIGCLLDRVVHPEEKPDYTDYLQFAAWIRFVTRHGPELDEAKVSCFHDWMRAVRNLVLNTEVRAETFRRQLAGLDLLLGGSENILDFLANSENVITGFEERQLTEEQLKASLVIADITWKPLLQCAEDHGYFRGQIDFLLDFSGAKSSEVDHGQSQGKFEFYLGNAQAMFDDNGLRKREGNDFLWERSLLAVGDYFLSYGWYSKSFLSKGDRNSPLSWKRLLREYHVDKRAHLKTLWDRLASESLEQIAANPPQRQWQQALCSTPDAWAYCGQCLVRFVTREHLPPRVFLMSGQRRRAAYAELFTFCLMQEVKLDSTRSRFMPLEFIGLKSDTGSDEEPHLRFEFEFCGKTHIFLMYCQHENDTGYSLWFNDKDLDPNLGQLLQSIGFVTATSGQTEYLVKRQEPGDPLNGAVFLDSLAADLKQQLNHHHS